jgi:hypothetical protein
VNDSGLTAGRRLFVAGLFCLGAAWIAGPAPRFCVALLLLMVAPGYLIERSIGGPRPALLVRSALWVGLSLSAIALLYQAAWVVSLRLSPAVLTALLLALSVAAALAAWRDLGADAAIQPPGERLQAGAWLLFGLICLLTLGLRFVHIADLALPAWVDPVHHTLMVRVAAERGMAPVDLTPYLAVTELPYHWGYHVLIAAAYVLSGLDLPATLLWSGQILNALQAPAAGALALLLWRKPAAAVAAALIVGLVSIFPAYYVSWGRYTQLAGLLLLPALAAAWAYGLGGHLSWPMPVALTPNPLSRGLRPQERGLSETQFPPEEAEGEGRNPLFMTTDPLGAGGSRRGWWIAAALLLAGLSLIHFRVLVFGLALIASQSAIWVIGASVRQIRRNLLAVALTALGAIGLAGPWLWLLAQRALLPALPQPQTLVGESSYTALSLGLLWAGQNRALVALALLSAFVLVARRRRAALVMLGWVGGLLILANPGLLTYLLPAIGLPLLINGALQRSWRTALIGAPLVLINPWLVRLPATWLINNESVVISLFLPLSVLIGGAAAGALAMLRRRARRLGRAGGPLAAALTIAVALWGGWQLRDVLNRGTVFATAADLAAITWVSANTPPDARFLINATPWLGAADRGVDGGWWLLPLAGRWTSTPPVLFIYGAPEEVAAARERSRTVITFQPGQEATIDALIAREGIDYLYFGPQPGPLRPEQFRTRPGFRSVYEYDGVTILAVGS